MYNFEGIEKGLQKKTFAREEKAKQVAGITAELGVKIRQAAIKFGLDYEAYEKEADAEKKQAIMSQIVESTIETDKLKEQMAWSSNFDTAVKVMDVLLVGGSEGLTKDNFSADDAEVVWNDFFTQKSNIKSTPSPTK